MGRLASSFCCAGPGRTSQGFPRPGPRYPEAQLIPGLVLFRWDAPLFFANAELFNQRVLDSIAKLPTPVRCVVVTAEPVTSVDVTAADALNELRETLSAAQIQLWFAEMKDPVKDKLKRFGLLPRLGERNFFATISEAVDSYVTTSAFGRTDVSSSTKTC